MSQLLAENLELGEGQIRGAGTIGNILEGQDLSGGGAGAIAGIFEQQISNIIGFFTLVGALFFIINFFSAAFSWIQSGGDKGAVEKAQQKMINAAIGMFVMVLAIGIVGIVGGVTGIDLLNPARVFVELIPRGAN